MNLPEKCIVDTNVPKMANRALQCDDILPEEQNCIRACIAAIEHVITKNDCLVIDEGDEILSEYRRNLNMSGSPGVGDRFMKWVYDHCWGLPADNRVKITQSGVSYKEFPNTTEHPGLEDFDRSDRKFIAVANAHCQKPPILQATDSKWWGWKDALFEAGITVKFLCKEYVKRKYAEKIGA